jgi:hypothetical protein
MWRMWDLAVRHLVVPKMANSFQIGTAVLPCDRCRPKAANSFQIGSEVFSQLLPIVSGAVPTCTSVKVAALWLMGMLWQAHQFVTTNRRVNVHAAIMAAMQARPSDEQVCTAACWALATTLRRSCPDTETVACAAAATLAHSLELFGGERDDLASYALRALVILAGYSRARKLLQQRVATSVATVGLIRRQLQSGSLGSRSRYLNPIVGSACALIGHLSAADELQARASAALTRLRIDYLHFSCTGSVSCVGGVGCCPFGGGAVVWERQR